MPRCKIVEGGKARVEEMTDEALALMLGNPCVERLDRPGSVVRLVVHSEPIAKKKTEMKVSKRKYTKRPVFGGSKD